MVLKEESQEEVQFCCQTGDDVVSILRNQYGGLAVLAESAAVSLMYKLVLYVRVWVWMPILYPSSTHNRPLHLFTFPIPKHDHPRDLRFEVPASKYLEKSVFDVFFTSAPPLSAPLTLVTQQSSDSKSPHRKTSRNAFFEKFVNDVFLTPTECSFDLGGGGGHSTPCPRPPLNHHSSRKSRFRCFHKKCFFDPGSVFL